MKIVKMDITSMYLHCSSLLEEGNITEEEFRQLINPLKKLKVAVNNDMTNIIEMDIPAMFSNYCTGLKEKEITPSGFLRLIDPLRRLDVVVDDNGQFPSGKSFRKNGQKYIPDD